MCAIIHLCPVLQHAPQRAVTSRRLAPEWLTINLTTIMNCKQVLWGSACTVVHMLNALNLSHMHGKLTANFWFESWP